VISKSVKTPTKIAFIYANRGGARPCGSKKVAVAQSKHAGKLVDTRLSELVYEQALLFTPNSGGKTKLA
jgi:hypothetical protein